MNNTVIDAIVNRYSVKKYLDKEVSEELIDEVVKAGIYAPTGKNAQAPIILKITNKEVRDQLSKLNAQALGREGIDPFYGAPVVLVVLAKKDVATYVYDGSCVAENMLVAASSLGLGACWIHRAKQEFETEYGKNLLLSLGINDEYEGIANIILGYEDGKSSPKARKENWVYTIK